MRLPAEVTVAMPRTDDAHGIGVARASAAPPDVAGGTVREFVMRVANLIEEVDAVRARKERRAYGVHIRVAPALFRTPKNSRG